jgi:hypothetical protein
MATPRLVARTYANPTNTVRQLSLKLNVFRSKLCIDVLFIYILHLVQEVTVFVVVFTVVAQRLACGAIALFPRLASARRLVVLIPEGRETNSSARFEWTQGGKVELGRSAFRGSGYVLRGF